MALKSDVEGLGSILCCAIWHQLIEARRTRRRPSTPMNADPLGGTDAK